MEDKTKKIIFFIGSLFAALIFITSYAAFGNNSNTTTSTTTVSSANTVFVYGTANGVVVNYSYTTYITASSKNQVEALNATLNALTANGTVSSYVQVNSTAYQAILSGMNPYQFSRYLSGAFNYSNVSVGGLAYVRLPGTVNMYYGAGSAVPVAFPAKNYTVPLLDAVPIGSNVPIKIQVLITTSGTIYNNQIRLSEG